MTHVIHTIYRLAPESGGISMALHELVKHSNELFGVTHSIVSTDRGLAAGYCVDGADVVNFPRPPYWSLSKTLRRIAGGHKTVVFHDHGMWTSVNQASHRMSRRLGFPRVVSTHGLLMPWAMQHKGLKKRMAWSLYGKRTLDAADAIHVTSEPEAHELSKLGVSRPTSLIPLGISFPDAGFEQPSLRNGRQFLFLGRVHQVKGIDTLLTVWPKIARPEWELIIAGPDEEGIIAKNGLPDRATYLGPLNFQEKWQAMHRADVCVLPSHTENFGLVIGESLAAGTPVITTQATPWPVIAAENCGWWIKDNPAELARAMQAAMACTPEELASMGARGRDYVRQELSWPNYAERMLELYNNILKKVDNPS